MTGRRQCICDRVAEAAVVHTIECRDQPDPTRPDAGQARGQDVPLPEWWESRFMTKVRVTESGCWEWTAYRGVYGYGHFGTYRPRRTRIAHRVSYEVLKGAIPEGLQLDHLCRNPSCVNPDHLEPVTPAVNTYRSSAVTAINKAKTHCINGHAFDEANTYHPPHGGRRCRACRAQRDRAKRAAA